MPRDSFNPNRSGSPEAQEVSGGTRRRFNRSQKEVDLDGEAIDTFSFDVSAAEAADLKQKARVDAQQRQPRLPTTKATGLNDRIDPAHQAPFIRVAEPTSARRKSPSLVASLMLHAALLLPLGFFSQATLQEPNHAGILVSFEPREELEQVDILEDIDFDPAVHDEANDVAPIADFPAPETLELAELSTGSTLVESSDAVALDSVSLGDLDSLFGESGGNISGPAESPVGAPLAEFFGTKVVGNRVVYVLDNSGGMRTGELETLIAELLRSVNSLTPKQRFYVIFYSDALYPLFYPHAPRNFVSASKENKRLLEKWLETVEFCVGNVVDDALAAATAIHPDVVYLLTDGDLDTTRDQRRIRFLLDRSRRSFPIHTFGIGTGETGKAALQLKQVAQANEGTFKAVKIAPDASALAKIKARPYHNKSPGERWGLQVGKRKR